MTFLPSELITRALNAMDSTIRNLESLRNIFHQTYGDESREVRTIDGCIGDIQSRYIKLDREYQEFRDKLFNHPEQYYSELKKREEKL